MTETQAAAAAAEPITGQVVPASAAGADLAVPFGRQELEQLLNPYTIDMREWVRAIMRIDEFTEANAEETTLGMLAAILGAESSEAALSALDVNRAKELCGNEPGGKSPVLEITGARPLRSDYTEGASCYVIFQAISVAEGTRIQVTTGAAAVQTMIWKHMFEGWMPFRAMLEIRREKTRAGYYPLNLVAGI